MDNVVPLKNARDWKYFDARLTELRKQDVGTIIERGRVLIEMKEELLEHGSFEATVKRHFSPSTARKLMTIAKHPILSNRSLGNDLPPSWVALYALTKLPNDMLQAKLKDGDINPATQRKDVAAMMPNAKPKKEKEKKKPTSGVQIKNAVFADLKPRLIQLFERMSKSERLHAFSELAKSFADISVSGRVATMQIGQTKTGKLKTTWKTTSKKRE